jgi:hypothetical protein
MADFKGTQDSELRARMEVVLGRLDGILKKIGPELIQIGHLREEAQLILTELRERGLIPKEAPKKDEPVKV